ncbi:DsbA family oxidoreductase [Nonomuraea indica]|uniref:DsbA family protein n=1 Tax=Nonomuraea indica TaxID=1581193 RepID=A0ABW8A5Z5_9ACTN|nr:DsbA family oxidoreductase [Nonomuraea indica]
MKVRIVLDILCSWSYLGLTRFGRAAERFRAEGGRVEVEFLPFHLDPTASPAGMPLKERLVQRFGAAVLDGLEHMTKVAASDGLRLDYEHAIATHTGQAHGLIAVASAQGRGEQMAERLFRAHFTDGLNVGDPTVLHRLADEIGVAWNGEDATSVSSGLRLVRELGVTGVPVFIFNGGEVLSGAQSEEVFLDSLRGAEATGPRGV